MPTNDEQAKKWIDKFKETDGVLPQRGGAGETPRLSFQELFKQFQADPEVKKQTKKDQELNFLAFLSLCKAADVNPYLDGFVEADEKCRVTFFGPDTWDELGPTERLKDLIRKLK